MAPDRTIRPHRLRLVILDRDGVLNRNRSDYVTSLAQWTWIDGAREACARLLAHPIPVAVVTNQAAIGHGRLTEAGLAELHAHLLAGVRPAGGAAPLLLHCPHTPAADCACRKPRPGMVLAALRHFAVPPEETVLIGDHVTDLLAAEAAGCFSAHVRSGRGTAPDTPPTGYLGSFADLRAAVAALLPTAGRIRSDGQGAHP